MNLLPVLWLILYPLSPALRLYELVRWFLAQVLHGFEDPDYIAELEENPEELAKLDRWLCDMESLLHIVIGYMVRDKLGLPFRDHRRSGRAQSRSGKPLTVEAVFTRFERLVLMLGDIERLAIKRAWRLKNQLDANPLNLPEHGPPPPAAAIFDSTAGANSNSSPPSAAAAFLDRRIRAPP